MVETPRECLHRWVQRQASPESWAWLDAQLAKLATDGEDRDLFITLGLIPRKLGKDDLVLDTADHAAATAARADWRVGEWSLDGAARALALLTFAGPRPFAETFKQLRCTSDAREMIALVRGLPIYPEPASLEFEATEALRSNIRAVFEAVAHHNPYPRDVFTEHRWNHMVLKALFVGSRLAPIVGLDARANAELARILRDFAHERWAAGREVPFELWRCVGPFATDDAALADLDRALEGGAPGRQAAALALTASPAPAARAKLGDAPDLEAAIAAGTLSWTTLEAETPTP